jgi:hypothetical protein
MLTRLHGRDWNHLWYRPYGPTAINPGLGRVRLSIRGPTSRSGLQVDNQQHASTSHNYDQPRAQLGTATHVQAPSSNSRHLLDLPRLPLVDPHTRLPRPDLRAPLIDVFFQHFGSIFPFVEKKALDGKLAGEMVDAGTILMVSMMCALSAR